jgi:hypothetical protein
MLSNAQLSNAHLSDDQLIDLLYGLSSDDAHLEHCGDCSQRWSELRCRRAQFAAGGEVSSAFLAAGRRKIYARLGERPGPRLKWAPAALAAACLLALSVLAHRPRPPLHTDVADAQLFADVYSIEQSTEPWAAAPINALFEDNQ